MLQNTPPLSATDTGSNTPQPADDNLLPQSIISSTISPPSKFLPIRSSSKRANSVSSDIDRERFRSRLSSTNFDNLIPKNKFKYTKSNSTTNLDFFDPFSNYFVDHRTLANLTQINLISTDELCLFLSRYYSRELPDVETMFPWLHGIHKDNIAQIRFMANTMALNNNSNLSNGSVSSLSNELIPSDFKFDPPLSTRNLMVIRSSNLNGDISSNYQNMIVETSGLIKGTVSIEDVLVSLPDISQLRSYIRSLLDDKILELIPFDVIIKDCFNVKVLPVFKDMDPQIGVSLRNFHIQVSKISTISDFIVYCFNEDHRCQIEKDSCISNDNNDDFLRCKCSSTARLLFIAQFIYAKNHSKLFEEQLNAMSSMTKKHRNLYNTFIVDELDLKKLDSFNLLSITTLDTECSVKNFGDLCSEYDLKVFNNWDSNYLYREKLEIAKMSTATHVMKDVWIGNTTDFECLQIQSNQFNSSNSTPTKASYPGDIVVSGEDIPLASTPLHCDPKNTIVTLTKDDFVSEDDHDDETHDHRSERTKTNNFDEKLITFPKAKWRLFIHCVEGSRFPSLQDLKQLFETDIDSLNQIYLEFPPSGSLGIGDLLEDDLLSIINMCKLLYYKCSPKFPALIYCSDGYTESSLLSLSFLMYSENISIDDAIIRLHCHYGRPFFIFKSDYLLLQKLEPLLQRYSPLNELSDKSLDLEPVHSFILKSILFSTSSNNNKLNQLDLQMNNSVIKTSTGTHIIQLRGSSSMIKSSSDGNATGSGAGTQSPSENLEGISSDSDSLSSSNSSVDEEQIKVDTEGCCESVFGSLPSRILSGLYLGSLSHASSLRLLNRLGIKSLVSVGENIPWLNVLHYETSVTESGCEILKISPGQKDLNGVPCLVEEVMKISNINDDGIGTLTTTINNALDFIDKWYNLNGKVLVHCQVGVSRSATVCIAEVMKRLNISLPRAYLFVRVRRLNVIIQPNLKLMYELFKWEESFVKSQWKKLKPKNSRTDSISSELSNSTSVSSLFSERNQSYSFSSSLTSFNGSYSNANSKISGVGGRSSMNYSYTTSNAIAEEDDDDDDEEEDDDDEVFIDDELDHSETSTKANSVNSTGLRSCSLSSSSNSTLKRPSFKTPFISQSQSPSSNSILINNSDSTSNNNNSSSFVPPTSLSFENSSFPSKLRKPLIENSIIGDGINHLSGVSPKTSVDLSNNSNSSGFELSNINGNNNNNNNNNTELELDPLPIYSNSPLYLREVDWIILCREIYNLNKAYIKPVY